jgi:hypothetical protein
VILRAALIDGCASYAHGVPRPTGKNAIKTPFASAGFP